MGGGPRRLTGRMLAAIITGILAAATLAAMVFVVGQASGWAVGFAPAPAVRSVGGAERTVALAAGQTLTLTVRQGAGVTFQDGPPGQVVMAATVHGTGVGSPPQPTWSEQRTPGGVHVTVSAGSGLASWLALPSGASIALRVTLPPGTNLDLNLDHGPVILSGAHPRATIRVGSGTITVSALRGDLNATIADGRIAVAQLHSVGGADLTLTNGDLRVSDATLGGTLRVRDVNGSLTLTGIRPGGFDLATVNGSISYEGGGGSGGRAVTVNGSVALGLRRPSGTGHYLMTTSRAEGPWPDGSGPELGTIQLRAVNGQVRWSAAPAGG